ncbi:hypothetical protein MKX07_002100 [Trichoderma sp. CBMAI-0711]|uniref:Uncharacterized protein n=1 Tax=Trichoderma parareesei TaxID=858221 RepID=A0A2H2ZI53_TRIPA|nr:hypothetical protein MKX07_002100 [Trichoderma sp. CBMAI-0711]OTA02900.1 hypothetical protein A9Z42_0033350 [Trichoderma parareesei]
MSSQSLRSIYRARPELAQAGQALRGYFRQFTTTQSQLSDEAPPTNNSGGSSSSSGNARPTARQRTRAAANEINALVKERSGSGVQEAWNTTTSNAAAAAAATPAQPRVIDVRSLPRGGMLRGRGGLRGRGRGRGTGPNASGAGSGAPRAASPSGNRFAGAAARGGRGGSAQGAAGRGGGGRGGRTGGGGRGRATTNKKRADGGEDGGSNKAGGAGPRGKRQDPFERMDPQEQQFDDAARFGTRTEYKPSLNKEDLAAFVPAAPSSTRESRVAAVLEDLAVLGARGDAVGVPQNLQAKSYAAEVEGNGGARFFADGKAREAAERYLQEQRREKLLAEGKAEEEIPREPILQDAEEAVRKAVVENAVQGKHETPKFATDPVGIARAWHLRAGTYTQRDVDKFEKKLVSLLAVGGGKGGVKSQAKAS